MTEGSWQKALSFYDWQVQKTEKIQDNVYKVYGKEGEFCLKKLENPFRRNIFIFQVMKYLNQQNFSLSPAIFNAADGREYLLLEDEIWLVTIWVNGEKCCFENPSHLKAAANSLSLFHLAAQGLMVENQPKGYFLWQNRMAKQQKDLAFWAPKSTDQKTSFCKLYLKYWTKYYQQAQKAQNLLNLSSYQTVAKVAAAQNCFIHKDIAARNFVIDEKGKAWLIDYDYCRYDMHAVDIARLLERALKILDYKTEAADIILKEYCKVRKNAADEIGVAVALLYFPQRFWRLAQRYFTQGSLSPENENEYMAKLTELLEKHEKEISLLNYLSSFYNS